MSEEDLALDLGKIAALLGILTTAIFLVFKNPHALEYGGGTAMGMYLAAWWVWLRTTPVPFA